MSFQITSKKARIVENIVIYLLSLIIFISCFKPFMAGSGQIGIKAKPLEILRDSGRFPKVRFGMQDGRSSREAGLAAALVPNCIYGV